MRCDLSLCVVLFFAAALAGCGARPVAGGTPGVLRAGGNVLSDVQVTVYRRDGDAWRPLGFADTAADGTFQLVTNGAGGPLHLAPDEYRCTLESVGAPVRIPVEYSQADTTPLRITWPAAEESLRLDLPDALPLN